MRIVDSGLLPDERVVMAVGEPGLGGANNRYVISGLDLQNNPLAGDDYDGSFEEVTILFQNGNPAELGPNGVTMEQLIAICADRLRGFQAGPSPSGYNLMALHHLEMALHALNSRTREQQRLAAEKSGD